MTNFAVPNRFLMHIVIYILIWVHNQPCTWVYPSKGTLSPDSGSIHILLCPQKWQKSLQLWKDRTLYVKASYEAQVHVLKWIKQLDISHNPFSWDDGFPLWVKEASEYLFLNKYSKWSL